MNPRVQAPKITADNRFVRGATLSTYTSPRTRATRGSWISRRLSPNACLACESVGRALISRLLRAIFGREPS